MEYAIISFPVGEKIFSWLFHLLLFIFYGSDGITHVLLIFKGIRELKVRQIDHNIIFGW
jgi:hypothetical protein